MAAQHLSEMLPVASRDAVSVSTFQRRGDDTVLVVVLPRNLGYLRNRLPELVDGVKVIYQVAEPLTLN
ncbi:hypothetical protein [Burkholderia pseudomallei]|uniref:hypothetical protein n=1 Tax=Burkholderia pseudomallei TaxID=28450 RepID=UPI001CA5253F|nr:hypothetical protein [Burkholderia pseudomallei]